MDVLLQDLRFALRLVLKDRAFSITTILTLALAIGANTAIFTVVRSVLLRPLPYPEADRLVTAYDSFPGAGVERAGTSVPNYFDRVPLKDVFDSVALYEFTGSKIGEGPSAMGVPSMAVTPSFFRVLRTQAAHGRLFTEEEGTEGHERVAVLSYGVAARQPGGVDDIVGRQIRVNGRPYDVVGVLPEGFTFVDPEVRLWVPLAFSAEERAEDARYSQNQEQIARLADGATVEQAQARLDALTATYLERAGSLKSLLQEAGYHTKVVPFGDDMVRSIRAPLQLLWGGVLFLLLIAAVNITNLSLVRASGRVKELATRHVLGAATKRVTRQLVTETTLLTIAGGAAGILLGYWSLDALGWLGLGEIPRAHEIRLDGAVLAFALGLSAVLGIVVGAVPAMQIGGLNLATVLREDSRTGTAGRKARSVRRALVVAQVALAFVLLVGAGLLLASFRQLLATDPGFSPQHVLTARLRAESVRYPDDAALRSYADRVLERIRALPGVEAAGVSSFLPFSWDSSSNVIIPEGYAPTPGESVVSPSTLRVSPGYLEALRVPLLRGRFFTDSDTEGSPGVVIVDDRLAARFWPNADPIGRRMYLPRRPEDVANPGEDVVWLQVVGVVGSVKLKGLIEGEDARAGAYYLPFAQQTSRNIGLAIRSSSDLEALSAAVRRAVASIDPETQLHDIFAMSDRIERSLNPRRAPMLLSLGFGAVALLLAIVGLYGVLAYDVSQRTREIGIRIALGSDTRNILGLVVRDGLVMMGVGLAVGLAGAIALRRVISSQLYGVGAFDPVVMGCVIGVLAVAALIACLGPALRAARINPVEALAQQ